MRTCCARQTPAGSHSPFCASPDASYPEIGRRHDRELHGWRLRGERLDDYPSDKLSVLVDHVNWFRPIRMRQQLAKHFVMARGCRDDFIVAGDQSIEICGWPV